MTSKGSTDRTKNHDAARRNNPVERKPGRPGKTRYVMRDGRLVDIRDLRYSNRAISAPVTK